MKITRRQLRRIIKEAIDPNADQEEAAYAIIYAEAYVSKFNELWNLSYTAPAFFDIRDEFGGNQPVIKMMDATDNLEAILAAGIRDFKRGNSMGDTHAERTSALAANLPEENSIKREAEQAAQDDFRDNIYTGVEQIDILMNRQTPVGMSAVEALGVFGAEGGGVPFKDTAASDARALTALMDDDSVLAMLDKLVELMEDGKLHAALGI